MTKEISDIIVAFKAATQNGRQTALATVVHVEGSSYRRPGARMLIDSEGQITGAVSGGCLEGDALRKALLAIRQAEKKLVTYDTLHEDDVKFGVQLGCNGIVHILFEPIDGSDPNHPIALLEKCAAQRKNAVIVTLFSLEKYQAKQHGTCFFFDGEFAYGDLPEGKIARLVQNDALQVLTKQHSLLTAYPENEITALVQYLEPPVSLIIVGAGNDVMPLVDIAVLLGWHTTLVDGRATHANAQRFSKVGEIIVAKPAEAIKQIRIDERTVFILMTHNYNYDLLMLSALLPEKISYIGILGPKKRLQRMFHELEQGGQPISDKSKANIYGPTGLDIGAETPEEIALSVIAEIKTVLSQHKGGFLKDRLSAIHQRATAGLDTSPDE